MKRPLANRIVDFLALLCVVALGVTGLLVLFRLPPGSGHGLTVLGLSRHGWGAIHGWLAFVFVLLMALHLGLHWRWIQRAIEGPAHLTSWKRRAGIVGTLTLLVVVATLPLVVPTEGSTRGVAGEGEHEAHVMHAINGSMTIAELEADYGVPGHYLAGRLQLGHDLAPETTLGQVRRECGLTMRQLRAVILEYGEIDSLAGH